MKSFCLLALAALGLLVLPSCNTSAGFGQDVRKLGNNIERSANEAR
jgi:predicted small secreted protein